MTDLTGTYALRASEQDGRRLRPQLLREHYHDLSGTWGFAYDDQEVGEAEGWSDGRALPATITVPFPPESTASGIGDTGFHPVVWYRRELTAQDLAAAGAGASERADGRRLVLHLGAVDHRARVWVDGTLVGEHEGGHTPFAVDLTDALHRRGDGTPHVLVVRAQDDPQDLAQPRGKQEWQREPHSIWYHRTTGIWQPVWLESVDPVHVERLWWTCDLSRGTATARVVLSRAAGGMLGRAAAARVEVAVAHHGRPLGSVSVTVGTGDGDEREVVVTVPLAGQRNGQGYEELLWRPGAPVLLDAWVTVEVDGVARDVVASYLGLRSVGTRDGHLLVNDRPVVLRSVLSQGYWPDSHLAAPSADALREEVELIAALGFNAVRVHQKVEDPRFLFHADRLGLLVWGEMAATYTFDDTAVRRTVAEWSEAVIRDRSHPSIVTWVPLNESWGVQHIAHRPDQRALAEALYHLTKALDPTRPVISNDGWEQGTSDLWTIHDYEADGTRLAARYDVPAATLRASVDRTGPAGRRIRLDGTVEHGQPIMLTEFGGVKWSADEEPGGAWGYSEASDAADLDRRLTEILTAVERGLTEHADRGLAGWCWTQLTDTLQERNGLLTERRVPKLPIERLRALVRGEASPASAPREPTGEPGASTTVVGGPGEC